MIEVKDLSFKYSEEPILKNVSFSAHPGEITAVIGANGVGKSTMLKCIAGMENGRGEVYICGQNRSKMTMEEQSAKIGYLCQNGGCSADLNVFEVVLTGLVNQLSFHVSKEEIQKVQHILKVMNITQYADRKISHLSGGQQQLVFIAQTLVKKPEVLIMDEPTSALDLNHQFHLMDLLKKVTLEDKYTTLVCLHHLDLVARYADKVVILKDGSVYDEDTPDKAFTEQMFRDVYGVNVEFYRDRQGVRHMVPVERI